MSETVEYDREQLASMMGKVRKLIDTAESYDKDGKPEAAATFRQKAEALMAKYRIAEESLITGGTSGIIPEYLCFTLLEHDSEFSLHYNSLWYYIAEHCGLKTFTQWKWLPGNVEGLQAHAVGYAADLRYAEFLWSATRLVFGGKLEPSVNPALSDLENVYALRSAGLERNKIAKMIWGEATHANNAKVTKLYAQACADRGEDAVVAGRDLKASDYRTSYARGFAYRLSTRLQEARDAAGEASGGIVLHGRKERVEEAFYGLYPNRRPKARVVTEQEETGPCPRCQAAKTGECREHKTRKVSREEQRRWDRQTYGAAAQAGRSAGRRAADDVKIVQQTARAGRVGASEPTTSAGPAGAIGA